MAVDWSASLLRGAKTGNLDLVKEALKKVENRNATDFFGHNALTLAIINDQFPIVEYLVDEGANLNLINNVFLNFSLFCGITKLKYIKEYGGNSCLGGTALICAVRMNNFHTVQYLISKGADVNCADHENNTPLTDAIKKRCMEMIQYLLRAGAGMDRTKAELDEYARYHNTTFAFYWEDLKEKLEM